MTHFTLKGEKCDCSEPQQFASSPFDALREGMVRRYHFGRKSTAELSVRNRTAAPCATRRTSTFVQLGEGHIVPTVLPMADIAIGQ